MKRPFAVALFALAACTPAPAPEPAATTEQSTPASTATVETVQPEAPADAAIADEGDDAVQCMTFIRLEADTLAKATPPGDTAALDHAFAAWKTRAEMHYATDELAQFFASNIAVMDDTPPADIKTKAEACTARIPAPTSVP